MKIFTKKFSKKLAAKRKLWEILHPGKKSSCQYCQHYIIEIHQFKGGVGNYSKSWCGKWGPEFIPQQPIEREENWLNEGIHCLHWEPRKN